MNRDQHDRDDDLRDIAELIGEADEQVSTMSAQERDRLLQIADAAARHRRRNLDRQRNEPAAWSMSDPRG